MTKRAGSLLLLWLLVGVAARAEVTASVDRDAISISDSLVLTLKADAGEDLDSASLIPLERDFEVVSKNTTTRMTIVNGRTERSKELQIVMLPRRSGNLLIPALTVAGQRTAAIGIQVGKAPTGLDSSRDVFVESEVDRNEIFVQSQLIHTFRIYEAVDLSDRGRSELKLDDAIVEELDSASFQRMVNGRAYRVYEVKHAIFPQKSGELTIPPLSFNARKPANRRSFFSQGEPIRRRSQALSVQVKPVPAAWPDAPWIAARNLKVEESWSSQPTLLEVGDSATRTLTLIAEGLDASQLPAIEHPTIAGIKMYPDQPRAENSRGANGITGIGINSTALLITQPGEFRLPSIRIPWWDTDSNRLRYAEVPATQIRVAASTIPELAPAPAPVPAPAAPTVTPAPTATLWMWSTLAALMGWLGTAVWLSLQLRRQRAPAPLPVDQRESELFRQLLAACNDNRADATRAALQRWAQQLLGATGLPTLQQVASQLQCPPLSEALQQLENSLYAAGAGNWHGGELALALKQGRREYSRASAGPDNALPPLYGKHSHPDPAVGAYID